MADAHIPTGESTVSPGTSTGDAPPFRAPQAPRPGTSAPPVAPGQQLGDFEILRVLGAGAFATVFLARQFTLDRLVALKVSANPTGEARTLASLEHGHIVQVFSEQVHPEYGLRLLCMQYVPGLTLAQVIRELRKHPPADWSGRLILNILDQLAVEPAVLDPVALEGRAFLQGCDFSEAVCWLGARLAEALAHAHALGVLHRDIKPANILLNRYGRPFLADFNISRAARQESPAEEESIGGTVAYMAPEHLEAFRAGHDPEGRVGERSDIYSLGVVLYELLTACLPFERLPDGARPEDSLRAMAEERGFPAAPLRTLRPELPEALDRTVRRCLEPDPAARYQTALELAQALDGCRALRQVERALPPGGPISRAVTRRPAAVLIALTLLPHFLGSAVNIPYNAVRIVGDLTPDQKSCFGRLVLAYNLVVYPLCIGCLCAVVLGVVRAWHRSRAARAAPEETAAVRRRALRLPAWAIGLSAAGWLPGAVLFPLGLHLFSDPVTGAEFGHFMISFTISGLVALTYSYFGVQYAVVRVFYPQMWSDASGLRRHARAELQGLPGRLRFFQLLAGLIPLAGALLMITVGPAELTLTFRLLLMGLITLGMAGFGMALVVSSRLLQVMTAFVGVRPSDTPG